MQTSLDNIQSSLSQIMVRMDEQLNAIDERFNRLERQQDKTNNELSQVKSELRIANERIGINTQEISRVKATLREVNDKIDVKFESIDQKFDRLEFNQHEIRSDVNARFKETTVRIDNLYDHVDGMLELYKAHDSEIAALQYAYDRHEKMLAK